MEIFLKIVKGGNFSSLIKSMKIIEICYDFLFIQFYKECLFHSHDLISLMKKFWDLKTYNKGLHHLAVFFKTSLYLFVVIYWYCIRVRSYMKIIEKKIILKSLIFSESFILILEIFLSSFWIILFLIHTGWVINVIINCDLFSELRKYW